MRLSVLFLLVGLLLAGCTVYAPMQPTLPLLTRAGQAEVAATVQPTGRVEATGAYSPLPNVVVLGGLTGSPRLGHDNFLVTAQYELGAGLYKPLGHWLLGAQVGGGQAYCHRGYLDPGFPLIVAPRYREYEASYGKLFAQGGVAYFASRGMLSLTYRFTRVGFSYLTDRAIGPLPLSQMLRHEVALAERYPLGGAQRWQLVLTSGVSVSGSRQLADDYTEATTRANNNLLPALLFSLGVVYRIGPAN